jgi:hypothetical protein
VCIIWYIFKGSLHLHTIDKNKKSKIFTNETSEYVASIALRVNLLEDKIIKRADTKALLNFYNQVTKITDEFNNKLTQLEKSIVNE